MTEYYQKVRDYVIDLNYDISHEDEADGVLVVNDPSSGISNLVLGCADPILIMEQFILELPDESNGTLKKLLQKNRDIIHGAFVLDETGRRVIFRNTLELENLDLNELEASFNSLGLLLSEYSTDLISFSK
ncbi:YbjN domain-containing protein [Marinigracilibium pacificum]|uniref:YbjN domain-containing protein n=1 Tax=Marinigracilibium pacificum TaxID=2729599 RepID=A0A848IVN2_9BACT|nr:YbjN domain-containing protein [Marinigracilibium pacificum]NMM47301.1 YbjN domain-containing protein [Marinigracilibium pacificum]